MKKVLLFFFVLFITSIGFAQQYKSHKVAKGENVYRIAKRYNTTPEAIYKINPNAKEGIQEGQILAIPVIDDQEFQTHVVEEGDTVYNISKKYNTTPEAIYILNPEAVNGINLGQILRVAQIEKSDTANTPTENVSDPILDSIKPLEEIRKIVRFKTHKVKRKETLYGIAQKYDITVDDIKKHNKRLYSEEIRKRDRIRIPVFEEVAVEETETIVPVDTLGGRISTTTKYIVKPKETKYSISRRHGITVGELDQLNPNMDPNFPIGMEIIVPTTIFVPLEEIIEPEFELYEVQPKETIYSILKRTEISSDSLFKMNPYLREGLKAGMVITLPKTEAIDSLAINFPESKYVKLDNMLSNFKTKKLAIMLPFGLDTLNPDSRQETEEYIKSRKARGIRVALDFYKGVQMAVDSAKTRGVSIDLSVFDTQKNNNANYIKQLINQNNFDEMDVVIGPLYQSNVEAAAAELKKYETPVLSPLSNKESKLYSNFFQTIPTDVMLQDKLINYVANDSTDKNIIIIVQQGKKKHEEIKNKLIAKFPNAKIPRLEEGNYLYEVHLNKVLAKDKPNWVFLESDDVALISNVTPLLNAKAESHQITLFTTDKDDAFDDDNIKNEYLSNLHLHYPSIGKEYDNYDENNMTPFVKRYKKEYGTIPSTYAVRGFDITYDILMRLGTADDLYHAATFEGTTEYVENKFNYAKKLLGGYYNKASYIIKFDDDLKLTVIE
ncbi:PBP1 and LysM peptidoglycan-binding domain-containing protein [Aquimarina sp. 2201CG14-23]|uniref:PBP1 and LysM peptidoglycan-binding domain-containing protein n=1 Tax=Aquimarina mycalae TaxID=3040073 RepID=UPI002478166C|nr:LysM peptidoglycan-binding domain-containing protein [Aquimarina sp. 2201CG14-23]MDH7444375.1 LysM peptidoglycan-binding domain-containing protein [Aquimarina sp. 2201CG14-23]